MATELCPKCREVRNMAVTTSSRQVRREDGTAGRRVTRTYHCETCHAFVRAEEADEGPADSCGQ